MKGKKRTKKLIAGLFLIFALAFMIVPVKKVQASDGWGTCGDKITWYYHDNSGWLEIKGTGEMTSVQWETYKKKIKKVTISSGVTSVSKKAFYDCKNMTSVTLPKSIKTIGDHAFDASGIKAVNLPEGLTYIGSYCFAGCDALTSVKIPNSITELRSGTFWSCDNLQTVTLSNNLQSIGYECFSFSGLKSIKFPASLRSIGAHAFWSTKLSSVVIPSTVTEVKELAFWNCKRLYYAEFNAKCESMATFSGTPQLKAVKFGEGVTKIDKETFGGYEERPVHIYITSARTEIPYRLQIRGYYIYATKGSKAWEYCGETEEATFVDIKSTKGIQAWKTAIKSTQTCKVNFISSGKSVSTQTVFYGSKASKPNALKKKGYIFAGWYNGNKKYNFNAQVKSNITLKAKWTKVTVEKTAITSLRNSSGGKVVVKYKKISGSRYEIQYSYSSAFKQKSILATNQISYGFWGQNNRNVYVRVRAYKFDSAGNKVYGAFSSTKKIKIK